ncbi:MAG TPA: LuxR C-terminal-related transcriptional regulator, partial [Steroidobacteraceae bacterium]|nr:LuxR C-terminal-related transcriptional regulator [Steroidobacteraceae bacterium]
IEARLAALSLRREQGDSLAEGINLRWLAHLYRFYTGEPASLSYARAAVEVLEKLPPQRELAFAYSVLAWTSTLGEAPAVAVTWGDRAVVLAKQLDDAEALAAALNASSSARLRTHNDPVAWAELKQGLALALENRFEELAARAFMSLMTLALVHRQLLAALDYAEQGIAFCKEHDLDLYTARLYVRRAFAYMELGRWDEVANDLAQLDEASTVTPLERETSRFLRALLNLRRGQPDVASARRQLRESVPQLPPYSWYVLPANACAEAAWLQGDSGAVELTAGPALAAAITLGEPWRLGELAAWLQRVGRLPCGFDHPVAQPYALELGGDWRAAAAEWNRSSCPYQQGLALLAGDEAGLREALQIFDTLGAAPAASITRQRLHALGAHDVQRGPQASTRTDPHGLTRREREVLDLLVQNLSNQAIARKLHRSERTVEHHVSALLGKLGAASRAEVIELVRRPASAPKK